jgi:hypothetical protein
VRQYASYAAARAVPAPIAAGSSVLRHRFRYRVYFTDPTNVVGKPGFPSSPRPDREHEIELLDSMTRHFVVAGDWDLTPRPFGLHPAVEDLFVRGLPPERTRTYARMIMAVDSGDPVAARGCTSVAEVDAWFANLRTIYDGIAKHGYRSQVQLGRPPGDEITLCVGRDGRPLLLRHGNHRISIAKVLGVPRIPVIVRGVHTELLDRRPGSRTVQVLERRLQSLFTEASP